MLKIVRNPEFKAPVVVQMPADGGQREARFTARFRALTVSEHRDYDLAKSEDTDAFLRDILVGWDDLAEDDGSTFAFTPENVTRLLDLTFVRRALISAYFDATSGVKAARRGN